MTDTTVKTKESPQGRLKHEVEPGAQRSGAFESKQKNRLKGD